MSVLAKQMHLDKVQSFYKDRPGVIISESNLVLVQQVTNVATSYTYDVLVNEGAPLSYENRLAITDSFWASKMSFYVTSTGAQNDDPEVQFLTYNNETVIGVNFADWLNFYRGNMSITINNIKYIGYNFGL